MEDRTQNSPNILKKDQFNFPSKFIKRFPFLSNQTISVKITSPNKIDEDEKSGGIFDQCHFNIMSRYKNNKDYGTIKAKQLSFRNK